MAHETTTPGTPLSPTRRGDEERPGAAVAAPQGKVVRWDPAHLPRALPESAGWPVWLGRLAFGVLLVVGVPLFLRMPLWADSALYDTCAMTVLRGGVHYRDTFDTNLPG